MNIFRIFVVATGELKSVLLNIPNGIKSAKVGFMSPDPGAMENLSYRQVCSGSTGHVKVLYVELNNPNNHFEELIKFFFIFHDPSTKNRQGNNVGTQYASVNFCSDESQKEIAKRIKRDLQIAVDTKKVKYTYGIVETAIVDYAKFYPAHEEYQEHLLKNPNGYCNHHFRFKDWTEL